jgi:hypothetical protein
MSDGRRVLVCGPGERLEAHLEAYRTLGRSSSHGVSWNVKNRLGNGSWWLPVRGGWEFFLSRGPIWLTWMAREKLCLTCSSEQCNATSSPDPEIARGSCSSILLMRRTRIRACTYHRAVYENSVSTLDCDQGGL